MYECSTYYSCFFWINLLSASGKGYNRVRFTVKQTVETSLQSALGLTVADRVLGHLTSCCSCVKHHTHIALLQSASSIIVVSERFEIFKTARCSTAGEPKYVISSPLSTGASANAAACQTQRELLFMNAGFSRAFGSSEKQYIPQQMVVTRGTPCRNIPDTLLGIPVLLRLPLPGL